MIFWVTLGLLVVSIVITLVIWSKMTDHFISFIFAGIITLILLITSINMGIKIFNTYSTIDAFIESALQRQEMLDYMVQEGMYKDDFNINEKQYLADIQWWNEDLAHRKSMVNNFWYGIFYPDVYDQFHYIDITKIKCE